MHRTPPATQPPAPALIVPAADGVQPEHPCQWWYWSGQLRGASGRRIGFQAAFFAAEAIRGVLWGQMAHWALVDVDAGRFTSASRVWLGAPRRIAGRFALGSPCGGASAFGGDGSDRLRLVLGDLRLDLRARGGPVVPHYEGGAHDYEFGGYTYYYSRPRMIGCGELGRGREREAVGGEVWFDRQYGALSGALAEGWQWISAHLDDGSQVMVFGFNRAHGERFAALVDAEGRARWLGPEGFRLDPLGRWQSPASGVDYPCAWRLRTDAHDLEIRASLAAQEMSGGRWWGPVYWEGACEVTGSHRGVAYVELLGSLASILADRMRAADGAIGARRALAATLHHPAVALGLATGVSRVARWIPGLRPIFPERQVPQDIEQGGALSLLRLAARRPRAGARGEVRRAAAGE